MVWPSCTGNHKKTSITDNKEITLLLKCNGSCPKHHHSRAAKLLKIVCGYTRDCFVSYRKCSYLMDIQMSGTNEFMKDTAVPWNQTQLPWAGHSCSGCNMGRNTVSHPTVGSELPGKPEGTGASIFISHTALSQTAAWGSDPAVWLRERCHLLCVHECTNLQSRSPGKGLEEV